MTRGGRKPYILEGKETIELQGSGARHELRDK